MRRPFTFCLAYAFSFVTTGAVAVTMATLCALPFWALGWKGAAALAWVGAMIPGTWLGFLACYQWAKRIDGDEQKTPPAKPADVPRQANRVRNFYGDN